MRKSSLISFAAIVGASKAAPGVKSKRADSPSIATDYGTWVGATSGNVDSFRGIPFAQPPVGDLRFAAPRAPNTTYGTFTAQTWGPSCIQMLPLTTTTGVLGQLGGGVGGLVPEIPQLAAWLGGTEDCLTINVWKPSNTTGPLPVMFYIYGGGFTFGGTYQYNGGVLVEKSIEMGEPVIFVSANYRLGPLGFLAGAEVKPGGGDINAGFLDQRLALEWVQKYISSFGGDPGRVTIFGQSAGAISVGYHLVANGGDNGGLFHAAIMLSGSPLPTGGPAGGQEFYDELATRSGCGDAEDTFRCLQRVDSNVIRSVANTLPAIVSYDGLRFAFIPRTDGEVFTDDAYSLIENGSYSKVPIITGNCYDEGPILTMASLNITTGEAVSGYIETLFPSLNSTQISDILSLYPDTPAAGSPFDTYNLNTVTPQNKRVAAIAGDLVFQGPRRFVLNALSQTQNAWSYQSRAFQTTPVLGSFHSNDLYLLFNQLALNPTLTDEIQTRWISFANHYDPNPTNGSWVNWPQYGTSRQQLQFSDSETTVTTDNFRETQLNYVLSNARHLWP